MNMKFNDLSPGLTNIFNKVNAGIYLVDKKRRVTDWSKGAEKLTGYKKSEVLGKDCANFLKVVDDKGKSICHLCCPVTKVLNSGATLECEARGAYIHHKSGKRIPTRSTVTPLTDDKGKVIGAMKMMVDISEQIKVEKKLIKQAEKDTLTQLGNRRAFNQYLKHHCTQADECNTALSLLFIDIDDFKSFNDVFGHDEGDKALKALSKVLKENLRKDDRAFRYGGEEFVVILPNIDSVSAKKVANRIRKQFAELTFKIKKAKPFHKTISIGVASYQAGLLGRELLRLADQAMYQAKQAGKNKVVVV